MNFVNSAVKSPSILSKLILKSNNNINSKGLALSWKCFLQIFIFFPIIETMIAKFNNTIKNRIMFNVIEETFTSSSTSSQQFCMYSYCPIKFQFQFLYYLFASCCLNIYVMSSIYRLYELMLHGMAYISHAYYIKSN